MTFAVEENCEDVTLADPVPYWVPCSLWSALARGRAETLPSWRRLLDLLGRLQLGSGALSPYTLCMKRDPLLGFETLEFNLCPLPFLFPRKDVGLLENYDFTIITSTIHVSLEVPVPIPSKPIDPW